MSSSAPDVPVIAVLVDVSGVPRVVDPALPGLGVQRVVVIIRAENPVLPPGFAGAHHDFAHLAGGHLVPLPVDEGHVVQGGGLAHGAGAGLAARQVGDEQGGLGLAEALHQVDAGVLVETGGTPRG